MTALSDILVVDASRILAGPYCGQLFADHGATVVKIEPPEGDPNRRWPLMVEGLSTNFLSVNRGKKSVTLNLRSTEGRAIFNDLVSRCDVFIHNYLPDTATALGVDDERLAQLNSKLIRVVLTGYGAHGPLRNKPGYDTMVAAYSGIVSLTGEADQPPVKPGVSVIDLHAGALAFGGALAAVMACRGGHGKGQRINISLLETAVSLLGAHALNWLLAKQVDRREGANYGPIVPFGRYSCSDGFVMVGISGEAMWQRFCAALDRPDLTDDPRYASNGQRCLHEKELRIELERELDRQTMAHWTAVFDAADVTNSTVQTVDQVLQDPQVLANDMVVEARMRDGRSLSLLGVPFKMSGTPAIVDRAPPDLGQNTNEVLSTFLGLSEQQIEQLRTRGAI